MPVIKKITAAIPLTWCYVRKVLSLAYMKLIANSKLLKFQLIHRKLVSLSLWKVSLFVSWQHFCSFQLCYLLCKSLSYFLHMKSGLQTNSMWNCIFSAFIISSNNVYCFSINLFWQVISAECKNYIYSCCRHNKYSLKIATFLWNSGCLGYTFHLAIWFSYSVRIDAQRHFLSNVTVLGLDTKLYNYTWKYSETTKKRWPYNPKVNCESLVKFAWAKFEVHIRTTLLVLQDIDLVRETDSLWSLEGYLSVYSY